MDVKELKKEVDYRIGQKVIATLKIEDKGQDFIELDVLENGVLLGDSVMFKAGRQSVMGIGTLDGKIYYPFNQKAKKFGADINKKGNGNFRGLYIYIYETGKVKSVPWEAVTLKYEIIGKKKVVKADRFIKKQ
jgi:hypothetical protein